MLQQDIHIFTQCLNCKSLKVFGANEYWVVLYTMEQVQVTQEGKLNKDMIFVKVEERDQGYKYLCTSSANASHACPHLTEVSGSGYTPYASFYSTISSASDMGEG